MSRSVCEKAVQGCTSLYQAVPICTSLYQFVQGCTRLYQSVQGCTRLCQYVPVCARLHKSAPVCTSLYQYVQGCTNLYELFDFDEGDDLECDLAAALSPDDRKAADENSLDFQEHVQQVGSSGLTVGPFRTPIEPCTSSNFNFNYSFGLCVAMDKIC